MFEFFFQLSEQQSAHVIVHKKTLIKQFLPGAPVSAVGEDAHHGRRPDPGSGLQGSGGTLPQLSDTTNHQQAATVHQQPHPAGKCNIFNQN